MMGLRVPIRKISWVLFVAALGSGELQAQSVLLTDSTANWTPVFSLQEVRAHSPSLGITFGAMLRNAPVALEQVNSEVETAYLRTDGALWRDPWTGNIPLNLLPARDVGEFSVYGQHLSISSVRRQSPKPVIELDFFERGQEDRTLNLLYGQNLSELLHLEIAYSTISEQGDYDGFQGEYSTLRSGLRWEIDSTQSIQFRYSTFSSKQTEAQGIQGYTPVGFSFNPLIEVPIYPFTRVEPMTRRLALSWSRHPTHVLSTSLGLVRDTQEGIISSIPTASGGQSLDWMNQRTQWFSNIMSKGARGLLTGSLWLEHSRPESESISISKDPAWFFGVETEGEIRWTSKHSSSLRAQLMNSSNDGYRTGEIRMDHTWKSQNVGVTIGVGQRSHVPSLLMKFGQLPAVVNAPEWSLRQLSPNESLTPKTVTFIEASPTWFVESLRLEGTLAWLRTQNEWMRTSDGMWFNGPEYRSLQGSATASLQIRDVMLRLGGHAMDGAVEQTGTVEAACNECVSLPSSRELRVYGWGQVELERPFFDEATYVKMGLTMRAAPVQQAGWIWSPWLQQWIRAGHDLELPSTATVDAYLSARLRWMMIYMRMDQASDQIWQSGTMDSYGVPKSGRRFIFGIRVLFKN